MSDPAVEEAVGRLEYFLLQMDGYPAEISLNEDSGPEWWPTIGDLRLLLAERQRHLDLLREAAGVLEADGHEDRADIGCSYCALLARIRAAIGSKDDG